MPQTRDLVSLRVSVVTAVALVLAVCVYVWDSATWAAEQIAKDEAQDASIVRIETSAEKMKTSNDALQSVVLTLITELRSRGVVSETPVPNG